MINKVSIKNFQSHVDTVFELTPGVNVITGTSDHGKSAIMNALKWLIWNKPLGDELRNWNGGDMIVSVDLAEGITITKTKTKSQNFYQINDNEPLVGADVPEEVQKILNISEKINFHQQLNLPFLMTESPGEVARHFSKIAKIDSIHKTERTINSWISGINRGIEKHKSDIKKYNQELKEFPDLKKIEIELEVLEDLETKRNQISKGISDLSMMIRHIDVVNDRIEEDSRLLVFEKEVDGLLSQINEMNIMNDQILQLDGLITDIEMIEYKTKEFNEKIQHESLINNILAEIEKRRVITADFRALNELVDKIYYLDKKLIKTQENAVTMEKEFKRVFPSECPLCGTPKKEIKL